MPTSNVGTTWGLPLPGGWDLTNAYLRVTVRRTGSVGALRFFYIGITGSLATIDTASRYLNVRPASTGNVRTANWIADGARTREGASYEQMTVIGRDIPAGGAPYAYITLTAVSGQTVIMDIAKIELIQRTATKAKCVIWHDDSATATAAVMRSFMDPYGFKLTEAAFYGDLGATGLSSAARAREYTSAGHQIGYHTNTGPEHIQDSPANLLSQAYRNLRDSRNAGIVPGRDMAWWGGQPIDQASQDVVAASYRSGRYNTSGLQLAEQLPPAHPQAYKAHLVATSATFTGIWKPLIDNAILCKGMAAFVFHQDVRPAGSEDNFTNEFKAMLAWLDANRASINVVTAQQAFAA